MAEIQITEKGADDIILKLLQEVAPGIQVDINHFFDLLKHSLSLNVIEKKRVVDAVPTLSQLQFDKLEEVFLDERKKFQDLAKKHPEDIKKLLEKQQKEWLQLGDMYKSEQEKEGKKQEDEEKINDIKSQFGL